MLYRCNDGRALPPRFQQRPHVAEKTSPGLGSVISSRSHVRARDRASAILRVVPDRE